jgi:hypothetical protein
MKALDELAVIHALLEVGEGHGVFEFAFPGVSGFS